MQNIKWVSFCASNKVLKTMLHFFPLSTNSTTPYLISCKLGLFGEGKNADAVMVDGTRLNQASGILLDSAFPALNGDYPGFLGVSIEFSFRQQVINFEPSSVVVEFLYFSSSTYYYPSLLKENITSSKFFPILNDSLTQTSLVLVNSSLTDYTTDVLDNNGETLIKDLSVSKLTIKEYQLEGQKTVDTKKCAIDSCWASGFLNVIKFSNDIPSGVNSYVLCRDVTTKKITSCFAL